MVMILIIILFLFTVYFIVEMGNKLFDGKSAFIDFIIKYIRKFIILIRYIYGNIKQFFCKKSNKINADRRTVQNNGELFDSSSVWED